MLLNPISCSYRFQFKKNKLFLRSIGKYIYSFLNIILYKVSDILFFFTNVKFMFTENLKWLDFKKCLLTILIIHKPRFFFLFPVQICFGYHEIGCGNKGNANGSEMSADSCTYLSLVISWDAKHWIANSIIDGSFMKACHKQLRVHLKYHIIGFNMQEKQQNLPM